MRFTARFVAQIRSWEVGRIFLVLLILASFAAVQAASAIEVLPDHHGADDRCCAGGHAGHFPVLIDVRSVHIEKLSLAGWRAGIEFNSYTSGDSLTFNSSRAPPVSL